MSNEPEWKAYERAVRDELALVLPEAKIHLDVRLHGHRSKSTRQIDVLVEESLGNTVLRTAVDAKLYARPLDVKHVEEFIGMLGDLDVDRGILVTKSGYTESAMARAFADDVDLDLDILELGSLDLWQGRAAIPFAGSHGVMIFAPFGWAIDVRGGSGYLARLYRRGLTAQEAEDRWEWMYVNLWNRAHEIHSLDLLLAKQAADLTAAGAGRAVITHREVELRVNERTVIRRAELPQYRTAELTGFVEFPEFICFIVLLTPLYLERRNTRKLEYLLRKLKPGVSDA